MASLNPPTHPPQNPTEIEETKNFVRTNVKKHVCTSFQQFKQLWTQTEKHVWALTLVPSLVWSSCYDSFFDFRLLREKQVSGFIPRSSLWSMSMQFDVLVEIQQPHSLFSVLWFLIKGFDELEMEKKESF